MHQRENERNISAQGALNTTWDVLAIVNYTAAGWRDASTNATKVRIVEYPWWNTSFNCRRLINVTQNTANNGSGIVEIRNFTPDSPYCEILNCSKDIRITEVLQNESQVYIPYMNLSNPVYSHGADGGIEICSSVRIEFNSTLGTSQTKRFFIYYNNPLADADYSSLTVQNKISDNNFSSLNKRDTELVWDGFYNARLDIWWSNSSDQISLLDINDSIVASNATKTLGYIPYIDANRLSHQFYDTITMDKIYWYDGHGGISTILGINQTVFEIRQFNQTRPIQTISSNNITYNLTPNISTKFVMMLASFGGDDSTSLINCTLTNWLSKAFTEKGAGCYLSFLGQNVTTICNSCSCISDVGSEHVSNFSKCFWGNITVGATIRQASTNATSCSTPSMNPILINSTVNGCDIPLT